MPGEPTHFYPTAGEPRIMAVSAHGPAKRDSRQDSDCRAGDVPGTSDGVALVNVPAHGMSLIAKDKPLRWSDLVEVLDRVYAHQRSGRAIFFARVSLPARACWVEWSRFTKVTFDCDE